MWPNNSDSITQSFDASAVDVTPAAAASHVRVLYSPISNDPGIAGQCAAVLSDTELQRMARFISEDERDRFIQRRAFRRYCAALALESDKPLSSLAFAETEKGRPYLLERPEISFSFASFRSGYIAAWSATHRIGIDIEDPARDVEITELAQEYFSVAEMKAVEHANAAARPRTFFQLWTLKEAALKSIGEGLPLGLDAFQFQTQPELKIIQTPREYRSLHHFDAYIIDGTPGCAALVVSTPIP